MNKNIKIKPIFFSRRINSIAILIVLTTVLVLSYTDIDRSIYVFGASVVMFIALLVLFYLNSREIQEVRLSESEVALLFFNKKSIFFRKQEVVMRKEEVFASESSDKIVISNKENFIGQVRLKALENKDDIEVLRKYFFN